MQKKNSDRRSDGRPPGEHQRRGRGPVEDGDGAGGHQPPVGHRRGLQEEVREEDLDRIAGSGNFIFFGGGHSGQIFQFR